MLTAEELEAKAHAEYTAHLSKEIQVKGIAGYFADDSHDIVLDPPATVRVDPTPETDIKRWMDDWLDPVWDVTLVQPHPQLENMRSFWIHATSYHPDGRTEQGDVVSAS